MFEREPEVVAVELPRSARLVELPRVTLWSDAASAGATRIVMTFVWLVLAALVLLTVIGPHIPSGE